MINHTQGPWVVSRNEEVRAQQDGELIAKVRTHNAPLISAAPELLAALIALKGIYCLPDNDITRMADAAIAKAQGE